MLKSPKQIIDEMKVNSGEVNQRSSTANLLKAITKDAKQFFTDLFTGISNKLGKNKFDVEVKNQIVLPKVQQIDGEVSLKDTKALLIGLNEIVRGVENVKKTYEKASKNLEKTLKPEKVDFSVLEQAVKAIDIPEPLKEVSVNNLQDYSKQLDLIKKEISKLKLDPKIEVKTQTPQVSIDLEGVKTRLETIVEAISNLETKPEVNIDLKSVQKAVSQVEQAINDLRFPIPNFRVPEDIAYESDGINLHRSQSKLVAKKITVSGDNTYVCSAPIGSAEGDAVWQCKKIAVAGGTTTIIWADGDANFNNIATDPSLLDYS